MKRAGISLLLSLFGLSTFLLFTESGLRALVLAAQTLAPRGLLIEGIQGRLAGPLSCDRLRYHDGQLEIEIRQLHGDWQPGQLFHGILHISSLSSTGITLRLPPAQDKAPPPVLLPDVHLPLAITIDRLKLDQLSVAAAGETQATQLKHISLQARADGKGIEISQFEIDDPVLRFQLQGSLIPRDHYPLSAQMNWSLKVPEQPRLDGHGKINGDLQSLRVRQELSEPFHAQLDGRIDKPMDDWKWQAELNFDKLTSSHWTDTLPPWTSSGRMEGRGNARTMTVKGLLHARATGNTAIDIDFGIDYALTEQTISIEHAGFTMPDMPAQIMVTGNIGLGQAQPVFDIAAQWQQLGWPLQPPQQYLSPAGSLTFSGPADAYRLDLDARIGGPGLPHAHWLSTATGTTQGLDLSRLRIDILGGVVSGHGKLAWQPDLEGALFFSGERLNPGTLDNRWPGRLALDGQLKFALARDVLRLELPRLEVDGDVRDLPVSVRSNLKINGPNIVVSKLDVKTGNSTLTLSGEVSDHWQIGWQVHVPDLAALIPGGGGELEAEGRVTGSRSLPHVMIAAKARKARLAGTNVQAVSVKSDIDLADKQASQLNINLNEFHYGEVHINQAAITARGRKTAHELSLTAELPNLRLNWQLSGSWDNDHWQGFLQHALIDNDILGAWQLASPVTLVAARDRLRLTVACWTQASGQLCLDGRWQRGSGGDGRLRFDRFPLPKLTTLFLPTLAIAGEAGGEIALGLTAQSTITTATMQLGIAQGSLGLAGDEEQGRTIHIQNTNMTARLEGNSLRSDLSVDLDSIGTLEANLSVNRTALPASFGGTLEDSPVHGQLRADLKDLAVIASWLPDAEDIKGKLMADLQLAGSVRQPHIGGNVHLASGTARLPDLGILLRDIDMQLSAKDKDTVAFSAAAKSGHGELTARGTLAFTKTKDITLEVEAQGKDFMIVNTAEFQAQVSPELTINVRGNSIDVVGRLAIPNARIAPRSLTSSIKPTSDVAFVDNIRDQTPPPRWRLSSLIGLHLGDQVSFDGFGLKARISGDIAISDEPDRFTSGLGTLQITSGQYKAYGTKLDIEQGRLVYVGGPINDPGVDVRAVRKTGQITSGINVRGTLKKPEISVYSDPPMAEGDALSYLVLGRPMRQAQPQEGKLLFKAASSLGIAGGELLAKQIGRAFGIEEVGIKSEGSMENAALVIGKYLSPRLYLSYGVGLFAAVNTLKLRYQLSKKWVLETESGVNQGADLFYTLERQ